MVVFRSRTVQHNITGRKIKISAIADFPLDTAFSAMVNCKRVRIIFKLS